MIRNWDIVREEFSKFLENHIQGGTTEYPMDEYYLEDQGVMTTEEYNKYEFELCAYFDDRYFECKECGWTLPISDMADNDNWECMDCAD